MQSMNRQILLASILLILVCYVAHTAKYLTYLLKSTEIKIRVKIWQHTCDSVCEDNSWIYGKCRQRFYQTYTNVFIIFSRFYVL